MIILLLTLFLALRAGPQYCKFEDLKDHDDPHEEMIKMRLASGLVSADQQLKLLEYLRINGKARVREITCYLQYLEQSDKFTQPSSSATEEVHFNKRASPKAVASQSTKAWHAAVLTVASLGIKTSKTAQPEAASANYVDEWIISQRCAELAREMSTTILQLFIMFKR